MKFPTVIMHHQVTGLAALAKPHFEAALGADLNEADTLTYSFVVLAVKNLLSLYQEEAIASLIPDGDSLGIHAVRVDDLGRDDFAVVLIHAHYLSSNARVDGMEIGSGARKAIAAAHSLLEPGAPISPNSIWATQVAEVQARLLHGQRPHLRLLLCSNDQPASAAEMRYALEERPVDQRIQIEQIDSNQILEPFYPPHSLNVTLQFAGPSFLDYMGAVRVFHGRMSGTELARLLEAHGEAILREDRFHYSSAEDQRLHSAMCEGLSTPEGRFCFHFCNRGITFACDGLNVNYMQTNDCTVKVDRLRLVDGRKTCRAIRQAYHEQWESPPLPRNEDAYIVVKVCEVHGDQRTRMSGMDYAIGDRDPIAREVYRSQDALQLHLGMELGQLGHIYAYRRTSRHATAGEISIHAAARAVLAVWRRRPCESKHRAREHLGWMYSDIFTEELTGAQVVLAVQLMRLVDQRGRCLGDGSSALLRHGSDVVAMLMGQAVLSKLQLCLAQLDASKLQDAQSLVAREGSLLLEDAVQRVREALERISGGSTPSSVRLAALFLRGELTDEILRECESPHRWNAPTE